MAFDKSYLLMKISSLQSMNQMYRCHLTRRGRIVAGENLLAQTFADAIDEAERILAAQLGVDPPDGFEIWERAILLYTSP